MADENSTSSNRLKMAKCYIVSARSGGETRVQGWKSIRKISNLLRDRMRCGPRPY